MAPDKASVKNPTLTKVAAMAAPAPLSCAPAWSWTAPTQIAVGAPWEGRKRLHGSGRVWRGVEGVRCRRRQLLSAQSQRLQGRQG